MKSDIRFIVCCECRRRQVKPTCILLVYYSSDARENMIWSSCQIKMVCSCSSPCHVSWGCFYICIRLHFLYISFNRMSVLIQLLALCFIYNEIKFKSVYVWVTGNAQTLSQTITFAMCISLKNKILCDWSMLSS